MKTSIIPKYLILVITFFTILIPLGTSATSIKKTCSLILTNEEEIKCSISSLKMNLSGIADNIKTIKIVVKKEGSEKIFYKKTSTIKKDVWKIKSTKKFPEGIYDIQMTVRRNDIKTVTSGTLIIKDDIKTTARTSTTLAVTSIPLLSGGIVRAGTTVPISYLQITNVGKETATLKGFWIKQNGSASASSVIGLTTVDDSGIPRGSTNITDDSTLFGNGVAFAPASMIFAPGETRLFTIKASLAKETSTYLGKQLMIDVISVDSNTSITGRLPIRGTTWTISN